jgi:hypothetical protein
MDIRTAVAAGTAAALLAAAAAAPANAAETRPAYSCWTGGSAPTPMGADQPPAACSTGVYKVDRDGAFVRVVDNRAVSSWGDLLERLFE